VDSPRSSTFRVAIRRIYYGSSSMQLLGIAPGLEGAHTANNVMGLDDGDGKEYIPC
jgi:hypothetical protein